MSLIENNSLFDPRATKTFLSKREDFGSPIKHANSTLTQMPKGPQRARPKSPILPDVIQSSFLASSPNAQELSKKGSSNISIINDDEENSTSSKKLPKVSRRLPAAFAHGLQKVTGNIFK
jgi:hypothetical protein